MLLHVLRPAPGSFVHRLGSSSFRAYNKRNIQDLEMIAPSAVTYKARVRNDAEAAAKKKIWTCFWGQHQRFYKVGGALVWGLSRLAPTNTL